MFEMLLFKLDSAEPSAGVLLGIYFIGHLIYERNKIVLQPKTLIPTHI
jgi:hypothetical protein